MRTSGPDLVVRPVRAAATVELRRLVLRNGRPVALPGDDQPAFHLGGHDGDVLVATGNVRRDPAPWSPDEPGWRVRGMATAEGHRGRGAGTLVLDALFEHCRVEGGGVLWCHARTPARRFYERAGLQAIGEPWDDPEIGPHVVMWTRL